MKYVLFVGLLVGLVLGGYLLWRAVGESPAPSAPTEAGGETQTASGIVTNVDTSAVAADGPGLVMLTTAAGESRTIMAASFGRQLCAASDLVDPTEITVGDSVTVRGALDEAGRIVPCEQPDHFLRVIGHYENQTYGFSLAYEKGPTGYVLTEHPGGLGEHQEAVFGLTLTGSTEAKAPPVAPGETPPVIQVEVIENSARLSPAIWADRNQRAAGLNLPHTDIAEAVVGGANAITYTADGLYTTTKYVVAHGGNIYLLSGMYADASAKIYTDFQTIVDAFAFIQAPGQQ